jgi:hypothetical protein
VLTGVTIALLDPAAGVFFIAALFYVQWQLVPLVLIVAPLFWLLARRRLARLIHH